MQLHHDKHHQACVTGANTTLEQRSTGSCAGLADCLLGRVSSTRPRSGHCRAASHWRGQVQASMLHDRADRDHRAAAPVHGRIGVTTGGSSR